MGFPYEEKMIPTKVGSHSLVGISGTPPHSFGNYFTFAGTPDYKGLSQYDSGPRAINMWSENLEHWASLGNDTIKVRIYEGIFAFVVDERLPEGYITRLCFTGSRCPNVHLWKHLMELNGQSWEEKFCGCEDEDQHPRFNMFTTRSQEITREEVHTVFNQEYLDSVVREDRSLDQLLDEIVEDYGKIELVSNYEHCGHCKKKRIRHSSLNMPNPFKNWTIKEEVGVVVLGEGIDPDIFTILDSAKS